MTNKNKEALDILDGLRFYLCKNDPRSGIKDQCDKANITRQQINIIRAALMQNEVMDDEVGELISDLRKRIKYRKDLVRNNFDAPCRITLSHKEAETLITAATRKPEVVTVECMCEDGELSLDRHNVLELMNKYPNGVKIVKGEWWKYSLFINN